MSHFDDYLVLRLISFWEKINESDNDISYIEFEEMTNDILSYNIDNSDTAIDVIHKFLSFNFRNPDINYVFAMQIIILIVSRSLMKIDSDDKHYTYFQSLKNNFSNISLFMLSKSDVLKRSGILKNKDYQGEENVLHAYFKHRYDLKILKKYLKSIRKQHDKTAFLDDVRLDALSKKQIDNYYTMPADIVITFCELELGKLNPKEKSDGESLFYTILDDRNMEDIIDDLYRALQWRPYNDKSTQMGFINSSVTKSQFRSIFFLWRGKYFKPVIWMGTKEELNLFIKQLYKNKIISGQNKWKITLHVFDLESTHSGLTNARLGAAANYNKINNKNKKALIEMCLPVKPSK